MQNLCACKARQRMLLTFLQKRKSKIRGFSLSRLFKPLLIFIDEIWRKSIRRWAETLIDLSTDFHFRYATKNANMIPGRRGYDEENWIMSWRVKTRNRTSIKIRDEQRDWVSVGDICYQIVASILKVLCDRRILRVDSQIVRAWKWEKRRQTWVQ